MAEALLRRLRHYREVVGLRGIVAAVRGKAARVPALLPMRVAQARFPFHLRVPSTDVWMFEQIFIHREYDFDVTRPPRTIVDAGANIGLASICFASRFPEARIIAIEPEASNFALLERNVAPYRNVTALRAALWHEDGPLDLVDPDLGKSGFMTQDPRATEESFGRVLHRVPGMTVERVMREQGIEHIDILKIDIEGAEREVFRDASRWLGAVDALIVELHEPMKPGCERSFYAATAGFGPSWRQGENVFLSRRGACLARRAGDAASTGRAPL
jgi:FkbM family methyltransferase